MAPDSGEHGEGIAIALRDTAIAAEHWRARGGRPSAHGPDGPGRGGQGKGPWGEGPRPGVPGARRRLPRGGGVRVGSPKRRPRRGAGAVSGARSRGGHFALRAALMAAWAAARRAIGTR